MKERLPALRWRTSPPGHILGHARLPDIGTELEQFSVYPRRAPQWVGNAHLADQPPDLSRHPRATPARTSTSSASNTGNLRDATGSRSQAERWRALRGFSETAGRPNLEPSCRRLKIDHRLSRPLRSTMICCRNTNLGFHSRPRSEQIDHNPKNYSAEIPHLAEHYPILRLTPTGRNLRQGQSKHGVLHLKPALRLERGGQDRLDEANQRDHGPPSLGNSLP